MPLFRKIFPILIFGIILAVVFWKVEPPKSFTQVSPFQLIIFFIPLLLFLVFLTNLLFKSLLRSVTVGICLLIIIILQTLGALNWIIFIVLFLGTLLLVKFIKKPEIKRKKTRKLDTPPPPPPSILKQLKELPPAPRLKRLR